MKVAVCVITYQRCAGLRRLLDSVAAMQIQKTAPEITLVIVDNDPQGSARKVVAQMVVAFPFKMIYDIEPARGISAARNRAIQIAGNADFVIFVDDDETVCPEWLEQLLLMQMKGEADIVMGPVAPVFENPPADWIVSGGFFVKDCKKSGKLDKKYGSTANILIRRSCLDMLTEPFAEVFNLTGGADYYLLLKLKAMGAKICWAPKAGVAEYIMADRANARWILRRRFRVGNTLTMAERLLKPPGWWIIRPLKGFVRIVQGCVCLPFTMFLGKAERMQNIGLIFFGCGILAEFCGYRYQEYKIRKNGHD
jgi:succinoglycan biosynthesis protein ExoM